MAQGLEIPNGQPMYLLTKLMKDFNPIFVSAKGQTISFIGARNHLSLCLNVYESHQRFLNDDERKWDFKYALDSSNIITTDQISWFNNIHNSNKRENLNIIPHENHIEVSNKTCRGELKSFLDNPPIPIIPKMSGGVCIKINDMKDMVNRLKSIRSEVVEIEVGKVDLKLSGFNSETPEYYVDIASIKSIKKAGAKTAALKEILIISCQLASWISHRNAELQYFPSGAAQITASGPNSSIRCLLTAVKVS